MIMSRLLGEYSIWKDAWTGTQDIAHVGGPSASGVSVNESSAMTFSAVWIAVTLIGEALAGMSWNVLRDIVAGKEVVTGHNLHSLLRTRANPDQDSYTARSFVSDCALLWGNGYAEIDRNRQGKPIWLWPIHPSRIKVRRAGDNQIVYEISNEIGEEPKILSQDNMFHIKGPSPNGYTGYSVIRMARESIGLGLAAEKYGASFFGNGAIPGGLVMPDKQMNDAARQKFAERWEAAYGAGGSQKRVAVMPMGMKYEQIGIPPDDSQFLQTRAFQIDEVARWFKVPPTMLYELTNAHFRNIEHLAIQFVTRALLPWVKRWELEADWKLLTQRQRDAGEFTKFNVNSQMRGDTNTRRDFYKAMTSMGAFSVNDVLELEDRNTIGPVGDQRFVPMNMVPLGQAADMAAAKSSRSNGQPAPAQAPVASIPPAQRTGYYRRTTLRLFEDAVGKLVTKEVKAVKRAGGKFDASGFEDWADTFYAKHVLHIGEAVRPAADTLAELMLGKVSDDVSRSVEHVVGEWSVSYVKESRRALMQALSHDRVDQLCEAWSTTRRIQSAVGLSDRLVSVISSYNHTEQDDDEEDCT